MDVTLGLGSIAGGLLSGVGSIFAQKSANSANLRLAKMQNQWNVEQWERNNEYNTPANQIQRLEDAGLNSALMYQNAGDVGNSSTPAQGVQPPTMQPEMNHQSLQQMVDGFQQMANILIANKVANSNIALNVSKMSEIDANVKKIIPETLKNMESERKVNDEKINNLVQDTNKKIAETELARGNIDYYKQLIDESDSKRRLNDSQITLNDDIHRWFDKYQEMLIKTGYSNAAANTSNAIANRENAVTSRKEAVDKGWLIGFQVEGQKLVNRVQKEYGMVSAKARYLKDFYDAGVSWMKSHSTDNKWSFGAGPLEFSIGSQTTPWSLPNNLK
nr:pilot protein for DNA ejection [Microvirus sp.]